MQEWVGPSGLGSAGASRYPSSAAASHHHPARLSEALRSFVHRATAVEEWILFVRFDFAFRSEQGLGRKQFD